MLDQVVDQLAPSEGKVMVDCTLGGAGHATEVARRLGSDGLLIGIDQDQMALDAAERRLAHEAPDCDRLLLKGNFDRLDDLLLEAEVPGVDGFLFDLGVSSPQLDIPQRGFSFHEDAPLDMRMDPGNQTTSAAEVVATYSQGDLARILRAYGDERYASGIAKAIVRERAKAPIETTLQLVEVIKGAMPAAARRHGHPARRTFQALRIEVNHELDALETGLRAAVRWAMPGARICVISYHSLEDRIVKHVFSELSQGCTCPPDLPVCVCGNVSILDVKTRKPLVATDEEVAANPRARSALLRVSERRDTTDGAR